MDLFGLITWLLGGVLIFAFVICVIVFMIAFMWGIVEDIEEEQEDK